jgi:hypothetical protein
MVSLNTQLMYNPAVDLGSLPKQLVQSDGYFA